MSEPKLSNYASHYLELNSQALRKVDPRSIEKAVEIIQSTRGKGIIYTCGNGGSASTAEHFAADLCKWANLGYPEDSYLRGQCLNTNIARFTALVNDAGWPKVYLEQLKGVMTPRDVLVAISVHGGSGSDVAGPWSPNLNQAVEYAKSIGARSIGFSGFDGGNLAKICDTCITIPAESTPIVEGLHSVLAHTVCDLLRR